jgi:urease accessory protein
MNQVASNLRNTEQAGWSASLSLGYANRYGKTALVKRRHRGPLTVQRAFYPETSGTCHTYLLHPPAGIVGGDELKLDIELAESTKVLLTTPGANRWYYSSGCRAVMTQLAQVEAGASLEWLPQETLLFDGADAHLNSRVDLKGDARYFGWEILCLGRPAANETFEHGKLDFRLELWRDEGLVLRERFCSKGLPPGMDGYPALTTLTASGADDAALTIARQICATSPDGIYGATLVGDILICRGLARDCTPLTNLCRRLWTELRPLIRGDAAIPPRIWCT